MGWKDPKWWIGQGDEQKARKAKALDEFRAARQGMRDEAAAFGEARERGKVKREQRRAARAAERDQQQPEG